MRSFVALSSLILGGLIAFACSGDSDTGGDTLCQPGTDIFCLCKGGGQGTKRCKSDGNSFEHCINDRGDDCSEIEPSSSETATSTTGIGQGGSVGHGSSDTTGEPIGPSSSSTGVGGSTGTKQLYDSCCDASGCHDDQCASGWCPMGFCTQTCTSYEECGASVGDCITIGTTSVCLPYCEEKSDCEAAFGSPSTCGYSTTIDGLHFTTCADWGSSLELPPSGKSCTDDWQCNLGNAGQEFVCAFDACTQGCYSDFDCPTGFYCPSSGQLDTCE